LRTEKFPSQQLAGRLLTIYAQDMKRVLKTSKISGFKYQCIRVYKTLVLFLFEI